MDNKTPVLNPTEKTLQAQEIIKNYSKLPQYLTEVKENPIKANENQEISNSKDNFHYIREKRIYKRFLKEIKGKRVLNGVILADILGVTRQTIYKWLDTPKALEILQQNTNELLKNISNSRDWKASAYLLDKLQNNNKTDKETINLTNLIQVNTVVKKDDTGDISSV